MNTIEPDELFKGRSRQNSATWSVVSNSEVEHLDWILRLGMSQEKKFHLG